MLRDPGEHGVVARLFFLENRLGNNGERPLSYLTETPAGRRPWITPEETSYLVSLPLRRRPIALNLALFVLTVITTLSVGASLAVAYARNQPSYSLALNPLSVLLLPFRHPGQLLAGIPFSFTLLGILLAHELGHYLACRYYGIAASYPYFIPFPNIIGTLGAFIRIRSPIVNRKALFDVGISGPIVGFLFALPALAIAVAYSKVIPGSGFEGPILLGNPPLLVMLARYFHPDVRVSDIFLNPVGRAAWVGLFATALNLLPVGQLDGGHILYSLVGRKHRYISWGFCLLLIYLGSYWPGWLTFAVLLLFLGMRHPALLDPGQELDASRKWLAIVALAIFMLCFTPTPFVLR